MKSKLLLFVYVLFIVLLVILPLNDTEVSILSNTYIVKIRLDYLVHVGLFFPFLILIKQAYHHSPVSLMILTGLAFAVVCEGIQYVLPYRSFNINDLIANGIGIITGIVLVLSPVYNRFFSKR